MQPRRLWPLVLTLCVLYTVDWNKPSYTFLCLPTYAHTYGAQDPSIQRPNAAIVYLADFGHPDRIAELEQSLVLLQRNVLSRFPYRVLVFHDTTPYKLNVHVPQLELHPIVGFDTIPPYLNATEVRAVTRFSLGYRFMCRFWAHGFFQQPAVRNLTYYWRLDTEVYMVKPIAIDPFVYMEEHHLHYMYGSTDYEEPYVVVGLWEAIGTYMRLNHMHPRRLKDYTRADGSYNMWMYYNNFEVSRVDLWRSKAYDDFFDYIDRTGGILLRRWGDAPIRTLSLAALFPEARKEQWRGLCYHHKNFRLTL